MTEIPPAPPCADMVDRLNSCARDLNLGTGGSPPEIAERIVACAADLVRVYAERDEAQIRLKDIYENLGEGIHTAFRKGVDGKGSRAVWVAIRDMTDNGYGDALTWFAESVGLLPYLRRHNLIKEKT